VMAEPLELMMLSCVYGLRAWNNTLSENAYTTLFFMLYIIGRP
jgi:hypothetical protein